MPLINQWQIAAAYRTLLSLIGWLSVIATLGVLDGQPSWASLEMFTTQSNILCILYFTFAAIRMWNGEDRGGIPFALKWKGIATMAVTITFLVAWLVLRMPVGFGSWTQASLLGLHVVVPLMALADGPLFDVPGRLRWTDPFVWLTAPVVYLLEFLIVMAAGGSMGAGSQPAVGQATADAAAAGPALSATSRAPYPFLDFEALGVGTVALNIAALALATLALGFLAVALDHLRARLIPARAMRG